MNKIRLSDAVTIVHGSCFDFDHFPVEADAVISDPPFSDRVHDGHDAGAREGLDGASRKKLRYKAWSDDEVKRICAMLPPKGWVCILSDHVLARSWEARLIEVGRYVFAPIPVVVRGRSVRLSGDGPCSWTDWLVPARTAKEHRWGTLPGLYEGNPGSIQHMGGKPLNAMCRIVEDYTRPGDTVLDFCMGSGTTGIACLRTGRKFIGIELDDETFCVAKERLQRELAQRTLDLDYGDRGEAGR